MNILLTGATGYIGGRLLRRFEEGGRPVRCLVREPARLGNVAPTTEVVAGDCLDEPSVARALRGIRTAYYLVHSMTSPADFAETDRRAARMFGRAAAAAGVQRIVYLGGLADPARSLSKHLRSRRETGEMLRAGGVQVLELRASIVIGAGGASFEIIRALVERLPIMVCPRWVATPTQPIGIHDVLRYLEAAFDRPGASHEVVEIGGPDVVSYRDVMREYARLRGLRRWFIQVPLLTPRLSGLWLALVTPARSRIGRALVDGLKNPTIVHTTAARDLFGFAPEPLQLALQRAIEHGLSPHARRDTRVVEVDAPPARAFAPIQRIGGKTGWYFANRLWRVRAWLDRRLGGTSMSRGRATADDCRPGDAIDGWTVEAYEPDRLLRLSADLKLPGRGWLEFAVTPLPGGFSAIRQTATFDPKGLLGRAYWYAVLPAHALIFRGMLAAIARQAEAAHHALGTSVLRYQSAMPAAAADVFRWHERPEALLDLLPARRLVRIDRRSGDIRDGGTVTLSIGIGPIRFSWVARHVDYVAGSQFCDEQAAGPFSVWRHVHRVEAIGTYQSLLIDQVEFRLPGGALVHRLLTPLVRWLLRRAFARRHRIVRASLQALPPRVRRASTHGFVSMNSGRTVVRSPSS